MWTASCGKDRRTHAGAHHRQHGFVARGAAHDLRPNAAACERLLHPGLAADRRVRHHRCAVELGRAHRTVGEGVAAGHQQVGIVEQFEVFDVAVDAAVEERQVELMDLWLVGLLLEQPDVAAGVLVPKPAYDQRQDHVGHALEGADVDSAVAGDWAGYAADVSSRPRPQRTEPTDRR
jgi:hypothetical protein